MASDDVSEMKVLVDKLSSDTVSTNKKSLTALAKLTKKTENVIKLRRNGGLERLLDLIQRSNPKLTDMALSVLANCSLEVECRQEIRRLNGIAPLVLLLKNVAVTSIQNRASRALANLAEDGMNAKEIERLEGVDELVKLLNETTDKDCQQSLLRALRILCNTSMRKQIILNHDGIKTITSLLKSDKPAVVNCCIRALAELTKDCSKEFAQQIQENEGIKTIVKICGSDRPMMQHAAVLSLANLAPHSHVRVCIGSEGGIQSLYQHVKWSDPGHVTTKAIEGLCFCCREAVNRVKVRETGALELLLKLFSSHEFKHLHRKLVLAFTCFYYDEPSLEILINGGIVAALVAHLNTIISNASAVDEDEDDFSDQMSFTSDFSSPTLSPRSASNSFATDVKELSTNSESSEVFLEKVETLANQITSKGDLANRKTANFKRKSKSRVSFANELEGSIDVCTPHEALITRADDQLSFMEEGQTEGKCMSENFDGQDFCNIPTRNLNSTETPLSSTPNRSYKGEILSPLLISPLSCDQAELKPRSPSVPSDGAQKFDLLPSLPVKIDEMSQSTTLSSNHCSLLSPVKPKLGSFCTSTVSTKRHLGHNSIVMLSRFSQMTDPSSFLINKSCINVLLDYIGFLPHPSPKCLRLLNRLTLNPLCFKSLVVNRVASAIHQQLICGYKSATHCSCNAVVPPDTQNHSDDIGMTLGHLCCNTKRCCHCNRIPITSQKSCLESGNQLLGNLCTQAQTPYGKGALIHLLQRGSSDERKSCVLTLPHICSTQNLRCELIGERNGLRALIDLLCADIDNEMLPAAVESLAILASSGNIAAFCSTGDCLSRTGDVKGSSTTADVEDEVGMFVLPCQEKRSNSESMNRQTSMNKSTKLESMRQLSSTNFGACKYTTIHEGNFDLIFQLDSGDLVPCHRHVLIKLSQVFAAMLSANYLEATESQVRIPDVEHGVFSCAMHLLYGCRNCITVCKNLSTESLPRPEINEDSGPRTDSKRSDLSYLYSQNKDVKDEAELSVPHSSHLKFNFWIDLLAIADRFMLDSVKAFIEKQLILLIDTSTIVPACIHANFHHSSAVVRFCLCYLLNKVPELCCRYSLFKELLVSKERESILEELYMLLSTCLKREQRNA